MIAALYVSRKGPYWDRPGVDAWDEERDARKYTGPHPVVAHPPCQLWTNLTGVNYKRYGGAHNRPGNDGGRFAAALAAVAKWGGVLEHPAGSYAWNTFGLKTPEPGRWLGRNSLAGPFFWVTEVWQSAYGHKARKRTWLAYSGAAPGDLNWSQPTGTHQVGWFDRNKPTLGKREASATPRAFADLLISLAENSARR